MNARNRNVDLSVVVGTLGRLIGHRTANGTATKDIIAPPPILQFDADRSAVAAAMTASDDGQFRSITLREYTTEELVTIYQGKPNLLPIASIIEKSAGDSSRFGASGSARRGDALYTAEQAIIRQAIVESLRPLRERYNVAMRGLDNDVVNTNDRTVDIYLAGNLAGGFANGTFVPTGIDYHEAAAQHGLDRVRIFPYLIAPSTGNGAYFPTAAAAATISIRQIMAACLRPEIIRDEKLTGTRKPVSRIFEGPTIFCPSNGRVTFANRETAAALAALDINLRGDAGFSTDSFFTDFSSRVNGGHIGPEMIWRAVGHTVIEFDPRRAAEALDARIVGALVRSLRAGIGATTVVQLPVCTVPEVAALLESAERPTGTDIGTEAYSALANGRYDTIQSTVLETHGQLQQRVADYECRLNALSGQFVNDQVGKLDQQAQQAIATLGLTKTGKVLEMIGERQQAVATDFLQRHATLAGPDSSTYQDLVGQLQELAQKASHSSLVHTTITVIMIIAAIACLGVGMSMTIGLLGAVLGWSLISLGTVLGIGAVATNAFGSQRVTKRMQQIAIEATNHDLVIFDKRISNVRLLAGRTAINRMVERIEKLRMTISQADAKAQTLGIDADKRFNELAGGSVSLELPGVTLPTTADTEKIVNQFFAPRIGGLVGPIIPSCILDADAITTNIRACAQAEIANLKLDSVTVIDFIEKWPTAVDIDKFALERINESWPAATLDPTAEPGYVPPVLRIVRSCGGSQNTGPLMEKLRKVHVEEVNQVRDQDFGDPRRIIVSHERRFISHRQIAYLAVLEKEAQAVVTELEPFMTTCVPDARMLDEFRCGTNRDEASAWGTFVRSMARKIMIRQGDSTYLLRDPAIRGVFHVAGDDGRVAQGLTAIITRLTNDTTLRKSLDELYLTGLQRDGRTIIVKEYLAALHDAADYVPAGSTSKFIEVVSREIFKLMPECKTTEDAAKLVGFTLPTDTPAKADKPQRGRKPKDIVSSGKHADRQADRVKENSAPKGQHSTNGNGTGHRDNNAAIATRR